MSSKSNITNLDEIKSKLDQIDMLESLLDIPMTVCTKPEGRLDLVVPFMAEMEQKIQDNYD